MCTSKKFHVLFTCFFVFFLVFFQVACDEGSENENTSISQLVDHGNDPQPIDPVIAAMGELIIQTTPVEGAILIDGETVGFGTYTASLPVGEYSISFGDVEGYRSPEEQSANVIQDERTLISGFYEALEACYFENLAFNGNAYSGQLLQHAWNSLGSVEFNFADGTEWQAWTSGGSSISPSTGSGSGYFKLEYDTVNAMEFDTITIQGSGPGGDCEVVIHLWIYDEYSAPYITNFSATQNPVPLHGTTTLQFSVLGPISSWSLESAMGNTIKPSSAQLSGVVGGSFSAVLHADYRDDMPYSNDIITLTVTNPNFGIHSVQTLSILITDYTD